jgi:hypothetical protein
MNATGIFFDEPTVDALVAAVLRFESLEFRTDVLRAQAERFRPGIFRERMQERVDLILEKSGAPCVSPM